MGEPLFDGLSAAIVASGAVAVWMLRSAAGETADSERARRLNVIGLLWLGVAVSLLLYRWIEATTSLPVASRPNVWTSGTLAVLCGIGVAAAVKAMVGGTREQQEASFAIMAVCAAGALLVAAAWEWALVASALLFGVIVARWFFKSPTNVACSEDETEDESDPPREPLLVFGVSTALLLLLLGTWQHVIEHETHRMTRSPRYSAWPRPTALRDAWERTDWVTKPGDVESRERVAETASREQRVAIGLSLLLLVVTAAAWRNSRFELTDEGTDHAG